MTSKVKRRKLSVLRLAWLLFLGPCGFRAYLEIAEVDNLVFCWKKPKALQV
jgi:hypothetical protein